MSTLVTLKRPGRIDRGVEIDETITGLLAHGSPVAISVSGGKDSCAAAIATVEFLRSIIGYTAKNQMVLVHADLGDERPEMDVEWSDSLPACQRLATFLGVELLVVKRPAGGMMQRWETRWENNVERYVNLKCVRVILPWSTPSMRFCTSELKSAPIASALVKRFPGQQIISACGIRREEGKGKSQSPRTNAATSKPNNRLTNKRAGTSGVDWNPIAAWTEADVFAFCAERGFQMHDGYALGMKRISCRVCIMQDESDQRISASVPANQPLIRTVIKLETRSTFAFQGARWLGDVASDLLNADELVALRDAKERGRRRSDVEARIPKYLLYTEGSPTVMPTAQEAVMLSEVRIAVAAIMGFSVRYTTSEQIIARYAELMRANALREAKKRKKPTRSLDVDR